VGALVLSGSDRARNPAVPVRPTASRTREVIPAEGVAQLLPHDPLRQYAYITPVDEAIVIGTTREQVQGSNNVGATVANPSGGYIPALSTTPVNSCRPDAWVFTSCRAP